MPRTAIIGVGTGSTANFFIDALAPLRTRYKGAVASSEATRERLKGHNFAIFDLNDIEEIAFDADGVEEIDACLNMIKGGGGADARKDRRRGGPEIHLHCRQLQAHRDDGALPAAGRSDPDGARAHVARELVKLGGTPALREGFITDNGNVILDVKSLAIIDQKALETQINHITGVVTNSLLAIRPADLLLLGTAEGVKTIF